MGLTATEVPITAEDMEALVHQTNVELKSLDEGIRKEMAAVDELRRQIASHYATIGVMEKQRGKLVAVLGDFMSTVAEALRSIPKHYVPASKLGQILDVAH